MSKIDLLKYGFNRREFLKTSLVAGVGISIPGVLGTLVGSIEAAQWPDLAVVHGTPPEAIVKAAIDSLGGIGRFVSRGDIVVVKPNIGWDRRPVFAANTNPAVVAAIVGLCREAGAKTVKVFDRTVSDPRRCYRQSGIAAAATAAGADVSYVDKRKFRDVAIDGMVLKKWPLYTEVLEADRVINVPVAKTHGLATLTMAMKNWMGVMGGWRSRIHQRLDESLVDIATVIKPTLTVLDAVGILTANGPQGGRVEDVKILNTVIAGVDQVAVDAYGATLFGMEGKDLGFVRIGHETGLGTMDLAKLKIAKIRV